MFSKGKGTGGPSATDSAPASSAEASRSTQSERPRASIGGVPSIISADLTITGNLHSDGDIQIEGQVDGDVLSRSLTIGQGAKVKGTVRADEVKIAGNLKGEVHAARVSITSTARVTGDVLHKSLSIESGAYIDGLCRRIEDPKAASASTAPTASSSASSGPTASSPAASSSSAPTPGGNGEAKPGEASKPASSGGLNLEGKA
jgi:cytoskeletal protein CcmA (bactofilin family)